MISDITAHERNFMRAAVVGSVNEQYDKSRSGARPTLFVPALLISDLVTELSDLAAEGIARCLARQITLERFLAQFATTASAQLHNELCASHNIRGGPQNQRRACTREVKFCVDLLHIFAFRYFGHVFRSSAAEQLVQILTGEGFTERERVDALDALLMSSLAPPGFHRVLLPILPRRPIIQINAATTHTKKASYIARKTVVQAVRRSIPADLYQVEATMDLTEAENRSDPTDRDEDVEAASYRIAFNILFTDEGGIGTGECIKLAEEHDVPILILQIQAEGIAARFTGSVGNRTWRTYQNAAEAVRAVQETLAAQRTRILAKHNQVWEAHQRSIEGIRAKFEQMEPSRFEQSPVTWKRADHLTSSPEIWHQSNSGSKETILKVLGLSLGSETVPVLSATQIDPNKVRESMERSTTELLTLAEHRGYTFARVEELRDADRFDRLMAGTGSLSEPKSYDDWVSTAQRLFGDAA